MEGCFRLEIEEELRVLLLIFGVHDVFCIDVLGQSVGTFDHWSDDVLDPYLFGLHQVPHGFTAPNLQPKLEISFSGNLHQAQEFVSPGALCLELCLDSRIPELIPAPLQAVEQLPFQMIHSRAFPVDVGSKVVQQWHSLRTLTLMLQSLTGQQTIPRRSKLR